MSDAEKQMYKVSPLLRALPTDNYSQYMKGLLVKHQPNQLQPYFDLINGQLDLGDYQEVLKTIAFVEHKFARQWSQKPWKIEFWKVKALLGTGQYEQASKRLAPLLLAQPNVPEHHLYQGILLTHKGRIDEAISAYQHSCRLRPVMVTCWFNLGQLYYQKGQYQQAMEAFAQALSVDPNIKQAYVAYAQAASKNNQPQLARRYLRHGLVLFAGDEALQKALAALGNKH